MPSLSIIMQPQDTPFQLVFGRKPKLPQDLIVSSSSEDNINGPGEVIITDGKSGWWENKTIKKEQKNDETAGKADGPERKTRE